MNKTFRLLQLINLLNHRQSVTLETIRETCRIPERTAYRYLNAISEVDVPVFYDKDQRAYRLTHRIPTGIDDLSLSDAVMTIAALKLLKKFVSREYVDEIDRLVTKIQVRQEQPVEDGMPIIDEQVRKMDHSDVMTESLSAALIHTAIACDRKVEISASGNNGSCNSLTLGSPALFFKQNWQLDERSKSNGIGTEVRKIRRVRIL